jgi:PAS domain S-box-containing protein
VLQRDLALGLAEAGSLRQAGELILRAAMGVSGLDAGGVYVVDAARGDLVLEVHAGLSAGFVQASRVVEAGTPRHAIVMQGSPVYAQVGDMALPTSGAAAREGLKCLVSLPVRGRSGVVGCINLGSRTRQGIPADTRVILATLAALLGGALDRIRAQEELRLTQFALNHASFAAYWARPDGQFFRVNDAACRMLGYTREELLALGIPDVDPHYPRGVLQEAWDRLRSSGGGVFVSQHRRKDGHLVHVELNATCGVFEGGEYVYCIATDVSERHEAARWLAAEKERLAVTLHSIGEGVLATDTRGHVALLNRVAQEMTGWPQDDAMGRPHREVFRLEPGQAGPLDMVDQVLRTGRTVQAQGHAVLLARDGTRRAVCMSAAPMHAAGGEVVGAVLVARDETERQRLLAGTARAERLESMGLLAGGIAHDFNNLLTGVFGNMELARYHLPPGSDGAACLETALQVATRAVGLTRQLLALGKGGVTTMRLGDLAEVARRSARFAASGSNVTCRVTASPGLWPCSFDEGQVSQVVDNLVINAKQAMLQGGVVTVTLANRDLAEGEVTPLQAGRYVCVSVRDTGCGIPAGQLSSIFDPFYTTKPEGTGLGLTTAYTIARNHGGTIEVESTRGQGSTFTLFLPASPGTVEPAPLEQTLPQGAGTVLVMDDEPFMRELTGQMLQRLGYDSVPAENGEEAVRLAQERCARGRPLHAAILDLTVRNGMGNKEAARRLRSQCEGLALVACSGYSEDPAMLDPVAHGFMEALPKPFQLPQLAAVLARVTAGARIPGKGGK